MNTDGVRALFEDLEGVSMHVKWNGKKYIPVVDKPLFINVTIETNHAYRLFKMGYQQATKELHTEFDAAWSELKAENETLQGHITYLRDEVADREAENKALKEQAK
jgi:hypothetical protein